MTAPLLLSMGDPAGIGPEITLKAWAALKDKSEFAFAIVAPPRVIAQANQDFDYPLKEIKTCADIASVFENALPILPIDGRVPTPGTPDPYHALSVTESIERCVSRCLSGEAAALVTNPIAKDVLYKAGFKFPGHTEYLGQLTLLEPPPYERGPVMMLSGGGLRVGLATVHLSLKDAAEQLSAEAIIRNARVMNGALQCDFGIRAPRISLTGLNPHAGENGALGHEENDIINPSARLLRSSGIQVTDAQPADTLFHAEARENYDAVLAMYHDQGLIPVKTLDFHGGVNITLGLPIVRTSPDHGTAFGIAGQNKARPNSLIAAIKSARHIANNRANYLQNGLN
ncbi:4-hydroxythreonine-4-phosphate dehydrogenase [Litorimonas taeanensis]|uniref:4-hydroxythreonine-4-phosphate dehydrogenase n=1 Tax=Litorimonas taeanensis TaxID=568099 RepID=A0A420WIL3_9PROT|nr:4-hydroxythreonine-4-phosphate dehydrogenase PdxA [Litorimonas taeanensis]RKQ70786.1 4-hydroxythreonine-4-phosphate dehydrogenase [Litorimonas taeanensis]